MELYILQFFTDPWRISSREHYDVKVITCAPEAWPLSGLSIGFEKTYIFLLHHLSSIYRIKAAPVETDYTYKVMHISTEKEAQKMAIQGQWKFRKDRLEWKLLGTSLEIGRYYYEHQIHLQQIETET